MSLVLTVDGDRWRAHLTAVAAATSGLVPVAKGNGYGLGLGRLARRTQWLADQGLGTDTLAVGTYGELDAVHQRYDGGLLVLTPWRPFEDPATEASYQRPLQRRVIHTLSRLEDVTGLLTRQPGSRIVLERATTMQRHGMTAKELRAAGKVLQERGLDHRLEGVAIHMPLANGTHLTEVKLLMADVIGSELDTRTIWVSHLTTAELADLRQTFPEYTFRPRIGTDLWLGDREALSVSATVLDVHQVQRGDTYGYRARSAPKPGHLLVVSGGTAHGIGLQAPTGDASVRSRATTLARGGLDAAGLVRSPYLVDGKHRRFAEPPHMQASMLFLPAGAEVPSVGDRVPVRVRYTATSFDRVDVI